ncbi:dTDP-4-dehydrorhamnose 3,5-epimerase [Methylophilaceae bacterium]|nr:dTDP-4-dehydrorhamnose 3,5-epimerase [Methylophilaceae bacterium]
MSRFDFFDTPINGLKLVQRKPIEDHRGFFSRFYCTETFSLAGNECHAIQINHSYSRKKGTLRGMHFQLPPFAEIKYVSCIKGSIFDVAVDLRKNSPTFLHWHGELLSDENQKGLFIPQGFAHGFQTLSDDSELLYVVSNSYDSLSERALNPNDPRLNIEWPLTISEISEKDRNYPFLQSDFYGVDLSDQT